MSRLARDLRTIRVLGSRDLRLFLRQRSRVVGTLAQPLLVWLAFGAGMAPTFRIPGSDLGYLQYFFPGTVLMLLLFSSIAATMSVIEDRHQGFLQGVLAGPGSSAAIALGKSLGSATIGLIQALLLVAVAPLAGYPYGGIRWGLLLLVLFATALALSALGFALAWRLDSTHGYHVVMNVVLVPLWAVSGALFPAEGLPGPLRTALVLNPLSYSVSGIRRALHGSISPGNAVLSGSDTLLEIAVPVGTAVLLLVAASALASRRRVSS